MLASAQARGSSSAGPTLSSWDSVLLLCRLNVCPARTVPPCVRYSISEYGWTLVPVLEVICAWGRGHLKRVGTYGVERG
jgi:hypothetical protein